MTNSRRRRVTLLAVVVTALVYGGDYVHEVSHRARGQPSSTTHAFSVLSYNVLFEGGAPERVMRALRDANADIIALQEVTPAWQQRLDAQLAARYPYARVHADDGAQGYAVYARYPLGPARVIGPPRAPFAQLMTVHAPGGALALANIHLRGPELSRREAPVENLRRFAVNAALRRAQWRDVVAQLDSVAQLKNRHPGMPHVLVGDLNTMEHDPLYREIGRRYVDAFRTISMAPGLTWPTLGRFPPLVRIDYVLTSPTLIVDDAQVIAGGSDHHAVLARLRR